MDPVTKRQKLSVETKITMDMKEEEEGEQLVDDGVDRISKLLPDIIDNVPSNILSSELFSSKKLLKLTLGGHFTIDIPATVCLPNLQALLLDIVQFRDDSSLKRLLIRCPALEELEVYSSSQTRHVLPQELFSSFTKLAKLQLEVYFVMNVPALVSLPVLEAMHLNNVIFPDNDSNKRLLRGCPSLRELELNINCVRILHVDAPFLSKLTVTYWGPCDRGKLVLETPSLRYLKVDGLAADACELTDVNQRVEAELYDISYPQGYKVVNDLIMGLSNVKTLYLSGSVMEAIANGGCEPQKFHKLTTLKLGMNYDIGWLRYLFC